MRIFDFSPDGVQDCRVTAWIHTEGESPEMADRNWPAVIICPGGGYGFVSEREADPIASFYFAEGYNTFVLYYSVGEQAKNLKPLCQLAATIAQVRKNADLWHVDPHKIAVQGGSAGGHLACSLGTLTNTPEFREAFDSDADVRPDAMILVYPVITADEYAHVGSIRNVSGSTEGTEAYAWFGLDHHVDAETPPTFLYHTGEDTLVPVQNSLRFADALAGCGIPCELHILHKGGHGMSSCTHTVGCRNTYNARWMRWSVMWLNDLFKFEL